MQLVQLACAVFQIRSPMVLLERTCSLKYALLAYPKPQMRVTYILCKFYGFCEEW